MKTKNILISLVSVLLIAFFVIRHYTYFYGLNSSLFPSNIPYKLKPNYISIDEYENKSFAIQNEFDINFLYMGIPIELNEVEYKIKDINSYFFNKEEFILDLTVDNDENIFLKINENESEGQQYLYSKISNSNIDFLVSKTKRILLKENLDIALMLKTISNIFIFMIFILFIFIYRNNRKK